MKNEAEDEFFVGYLPTPKRTKRAAILAATVLALGLLVLGAGASAFMRNPGRAQWDFHASAPLHGILMLRPYPMLLAVDPESPEDVRHFLLVGKGKHRAPVIPRAFDGQPAVVRGSRLRREGYAMLEISKAPELDATPDRAVLRRLRATRTHELGTMTLAGEIVDSKCWHGAMRPGMGRTHRACAQLCILGGIPPVLVTSGPRGEVIEYVLATRRRGPIHEPVLPFVAEPVEVTGIVEQTGDLRVLYTDVKAIRRVPL